MFLNELRKSAEQVDIKFNEEQLQQFDRFYNLVIEWNKKINLTTITEPRYFAIKHIIDSVLVWNDEKFPKVESIIDVGTGAGFPGIPLKIYKPHLKITLLDSLAKRVKFLTAVVDEIGLKDMTVIHSRAEDAAHNLELRETFDVAVSRAVAKLNILAEYCMPFIKSDGYFAALKGSNFKEEISDARGAIKVLGGNEIECINVELPNGDARNLIYVKKINVSPKKFPRKAGTPEKKPLI